MNVTFVIESWLLWLLLPVLVLSTINIALSIKKKRLEIELQERKNARE